MKTLEHQAHAINLTIAYDIPREYVLDFVHFYTYLKSMCIVDDEIIVSKFMKRMLVAQITGTPVFNDEFKKILCNEQ